MLLVIDCGNTNTKLGLYEGEVPGGRFRGVFRVATDAGLDAAGYRARLEGEMARAGLGGAPISGAALATVVPVARGALTDFAREVAGTEPVVVGASGVRLGLRVLVDRPGEVGADRLAGAVAAHAGWSGAKIVLDFGTGTTFDVVTEEGDYAGGVIAPGINLALDSLHAAAAQLPCVEVARPPRVIGKATVPAMQSGIYWGYIGLIEGIVARIRSEYGADRPFTVIATGGLAPLFAGGTDVIDATDPELTLRGLVLVHRLNRP